MRILLLFLSTIMFFVGYCQDVPKGTNMISVKNASIIQVIKALKVQGYGIKSIDSNLITTDFRNYTYSNSNSSLLNFQFNILIVDSIANISGVWYNDLYLSRGVLVGGTYPPKKDDLKPITPESKKKIFKEMNKFALSLKAEITYSKIQ